MRILAFDHVQLAMPPGAEDSARAFYAGVLGFAEVPKPAPLASRGGVWFSAGPVHLHLGVEKDFRPARKAHPALQVEHLSELIAKCEHAGCPVTHDGSLPEIRRVFIRDPFGNRIEFIERNPR